MIMNRIHSQFLRFSMRLPADIRVKTIPCGVSVAGGSGRFTFLPYLWVSNTLVSLLAAHPIAARNGFLINGCTEPIMFSLSIMTILLAWHSQANIKYYLPIEMRSILLRGKPYKVMIKNTTKGNSPRGAISSAKRPVYIPRSTASSTRRETPCVRLFIHSLIPAIVRVIIVRLCYRILLGGRIHSYLAPIR